MEKVFLLTSSQVRIEKRKIEQGASPTRSFIIKLRIPLVGIKLISPIIAQKKIETTANQR